MFASLMHEDDEIASFEYEEGSGHILQAHLVSDKDLLLVRAMREGKDQRKLLHAFMRSRRLGSMREDRDSVAAAFGVRNVYELLFQAGGFSLTDHFWYRLQGSDKNWRSGNFFDNDWDPAFAEAILAHDYDALAHADPAVPDLTLSGRSRKAWVRTPDGVRLFKEAHPEGGVDIQGEVLCSHMLERLLQPQDFVAYELVERGDRSYSSSAPVVGKDEDLLSALAYAENDVDPEGEMPPTKLLFEHGVYANAMRKFDVAEWERRFAQLAVMATLSMNSDTHFGNLAIVQNARTGALRAAPLFDFGCAFGTQDVGRTLKLASSVDLTRLVIAWSFRFLDPSWDYSWYDGNRIANFGAQIEAAFNANKSFPADFGPVVRQLFDAQLRYVNEVALQRA